MEEWQKRVLTEAEQLVERLHKLNVFRASQAYSMLPLDDRELLRE